MTDGSGESGEVAGWQSDTVEGGEEGNKDPSTGMSMARCGAIGELGEWRMKLLSSWRSWRSMAARAWASKGLGWRARCLAIDMPRRLDFLLLRWDMVRLLELIGDSGVRKHSCPLQREGRDKTGGAFCPV